MSKSEMKRLNVQLPKALRDWSYEAMKQKQTDSDEIERVKAERDALKNLLAECETTLAHARVFIGTREKMHPDGQFLYDELLAQVRAYRAAHQKDAP
jgi:porphobilinogen deaminase